MHDFMIQIMLFTLLLFIPGFLNAQSSDPDAEGSEFKLTIKPHICIAPRGQTSCISRIDVYWESNRLADVCLYSSIDSAQLQCWEQHQAGMFQHKVSLIKNLDYWLTPLNQQLMLVKSSVKFAALKPHRKHSRRRNQLPWSIQSL